MNRTQISKSASLVAVLGIVAAFSVVPSATAEEHVMCPHGHGFWKNHTPDSPRNQYHEWPTYELDLGDHMDVGYADLLSYLRAKPKDDVSVDLIHQIIAALLNEADGIDTSPIADEIADAHAAIGSNSLPGWGVYFGDPDFDEIMALVAALEAFNDGYETEGCFEEEILV